MPETFFVYVYDGWAIRVIDDVKKIQQNYMYTTLELFTTQYTEVILVTNF